jgi:tetratricopeptide (TPR) repeat protein
VNYYGRFFDSIETNQDTFILRGIEKPLIELLECSGLLDLIREKYKSITIEIPDKIPTLLSFSASIKELPRQKTIEYLGNHGFQIDSYTIPLSELACYYCLSQKKFSSKVGDTVVFLEATNATLHLMKLVFSESYFLIDGEIVSYRSKGVDPRKQAIVRFVVNEINKSTGILITDEEKKKEFERLEGKAEEWLNKLDINQNPNIPSHIPSISFSRAPHIKKSVLVRKGDVENDTGSYIQELMNIFDTYKEKNVQADVSAIFLLGDCFRNSLVKDRFEKIMNREKLFFYSNKDIYQILSAYPQIDINRYAHIEARIKVIAKAEELKKEEELALESRRKMEEEAEQKRQAEFEKEEQAKEDAKQLVERAIDLQKNDKLQDAYTNIENALTLDPGNVAYQKYLKSLNDNIEERSRKTEQYKSLLIKADKYFQTENFDEAGKQYHAALEVIPDNTYCLEQLIKIQEIVQKRQRECIALVKLADQLCDEKKWFQAKERYEEALKLCPQQKQFVFDKIKTCEIRINQFNNLMFEAICARKKKDFQEELSLLTDALTLKPDDNDIISRIKKIKFLLEFESNNSLKKNNADDLIKKSKSSINVNDDDFIVKTKKK